MNQPPESWEKEFDEKFCELKFGDGSIKGGGKSVWLSIKAPGIATDIKLFIRTLLHTQKQELVKMILDNVNEDTRLDLEDYVLIQTFLQGNSTET